MSLFRWRGPAFAVVLLLASVATASAECAWVLWSQITSALKDNTIRSGEWEIIQALGSQDLCERIIRVKVKDQPRGLAEMNAAQIGRGLDGTTLIHFKCLPDTIDPRGPKGK